MDSENSNSLKLEAIVTESPVVIEQLQKRIESLQQHNRVLQIEIDTYKLRIKSLEAENNRLRETSVTIQALAEQEEEYISNTLFKKIQTLKKEKESLVQHYEQEEEGLTNDLSRKLRQLQQEKCKLEQDLQQEQECLVNKLLRKTEKLEAEIAMKQTSLEQVRREKVELENTLEKEQEALVNKLWKKMTKLEAEKRMLQIQLDQPVSESSFMDDTNDDVNTTNMSSHIKVLKGEISRLRSKLAVIEKEHAEKMQKYVEEEKSVMEENAKLQKRLQLEIQKRETLSQQFSESESSLEIEDDGKSGGNISSRGILSPFSSRLNTSDSNNVSTSRNIDKRCYACGQEMSGSNIRLNILKPPTPPGTDTMVRPMSESVNSVIEEEMSKD